MIITGDPSVIEINPIQGWDPRQGYVTHRRWRGTQTTVQTVIDNLKTAGISWSKEQQGESPFYVVTGVFPTSEDGQGSDAQVANVWSLLSNDIELSYWLHPDVRAEFDKIDSGDVGSDAMNINALRRYIEAIVRGDTTVSITAIDGSTSIQPISLSILRSMVKGFGYGLNWDIFSNLLKSFSKGGESFMSVQFVLRKVKTFPDDGLLLMDYLGVGQFYSTSSLKSAETSLPKFLSDALPLGYWLKKGPHCEQILAHQYQITQEWYWVESYDKFIYGDPL